MNEYVREYSNRITPATDVKFFRGKEVEKSPAHGMETIFVVGIQSVTEILTWVEEYSVDTKSPIRHVCFGANKSFKPTTDAEWDSWVSMIKSLLKEDLWVTLDFDASHTEMIHESGLCEFRRFVPIISITLPYLSLFNYNTTVKIADSGFDTTNPGVWCHRLDSLMDHDRFTSWDTYRDDKVVK